ncbi:ANTAR domain-containing protein [Nocardioides antri]|uniref:ANTAR domain-containing protein n=1 Tax=Nocardioides antri TaxID=2607659 RepID=A0A5B1M5Y6_9ACTN|nr:ANTAR domain-containing protein [Nocardioides antri]KAA1428715.1 ANTAR domain-containing protein [Nocardioides antri]
MPASSPHLSLVHNGPLRRAVHHRALVEQAKGVLILLYRINSEQAFDVLRDWARETDATVVNVAQILVHAVCMGDDSREWDDAVRSHVEAAVGRLDGIRLPLPPSSAARPRPRLRPVQ